MSPIRTTAPPSSVWIERILGFNFLAGLSAQASAPTLSSAPRSSPLQRHLALPQSPAARESPLKRDRTFQAIMCVRRWSITRNRKLRRILLAPSRAAIFSATVCFSFDGHSRARQKIPQFRRFRIRRAQNRSTASAPARPRPAAARRPPAHSRIEGSPTSIWPPFEAFTNPLISDSCACGSIASPATIPRHPRQGLPPSAFSSIRAARSAASISAFAADRNLLRIRLGHFSDAISLGHGFFLRVRPKFRHFLL